MADNFGEIGSTGLKVFSGVVNEEFLPALRGLRGVRIYRQMSENDSTVGAVLAAVDLLLRAVEWKMKPANDSQQARDEAEFAMSLLNDMEVPLEDFLSEAMSMLTYGWSYFEVVLKRRVGPSESSPKRRSKYTDGRIGIMKMPIRSQDTLSRWSLSEHGDILGLWQLPPNKGGEVFIPINRALLFRTKNERNNPEGKSVLRNAYRSWYILKTIQDSEAIGIERELAGVPVAYIPSKYMVSSASAENKAFFTLIQQIVRDLKFNEQGGVVLPSDMFPNEDGSPSSEPMVRLELLSTAGRRTIETSPIVLRYQRDIARSVLADFLMMGADRGAFNLADNKTDMFLRACETYMGRVASVVNTMLLPRLWDYNGMSRDLMPEFGFGHIAPTDLGVLGNFIESLSRAGMPLFPDEKLETYVREEAGFPLDRSQEAVDAATLEAAMPPMPGDGGGTA